ncbi:MAG: SspB family protein [Pseudochelatococcus sp.]|jgi:hypothetical protein|uniref:SspB family protein n=1 Tax=Pseudochelatococcus sp. TaxID=2020869 RepID=UPI003D8C2908
MTQDYIRYDLHVQDALRGVVRKVLADVARDGLPGDHHFYITFLTRHPGVKLSSRVRARYPEEMTIVLQHQFWDLTVSETTFEVGLSFGSIPEKLVVPFEAMTGFFDRSVDFGLRFETELDTSDDDENNEAETDADAAAPEPAAFPRRIFEIAPARAGEGDEAQGDRARDESAQDAPVSLAQQEAGEAQPAEAEAGEPGRNDAPEGEGEQAGAQVVRLDAFRKKNT